MKVTLEEVKIINNYLDIFKLKIYEVEKWMLSNNQEVSAQVFKNNFLGIEERLHKLIVIFEGHNRR